MVVLLTFAAARGEPADLEFQLPEGERDATLGTPRAARVNERVRLDWRPWV